MMHSCRSSRRRAKACCRWLGVEVSGVSMVGSVIGLAAIRPLCDTGPLTWACVLQTIADPGSLMIDRWPIVAIGRDQARSRNPPARPITARAVPLGAVGEWLPDRRHAVPWKYRALSFLAASPQRAAWYPLPAVRCISAEVQDRSRRTCHQASVRPSVCSTHRPPQMRSPSANPSPCRVDRELAPPGGCARPDAPKERGGRSRLLSQ